MSKLFKIGLKAMKWLIIAFAAFIMIIVPTTSIVAGIFSWEVSEREIEKQYSRQLPLCVGMGTSYHQEGTHTVICKNRLFILIPYVFQHPGLFSVSQITEDGVTRIESGYFLDGLIFLLIIYVCATFIICKYGYPQVKKLIVKRKAEQTTSPDG